MLFSTRVATILIAVAFLGWGIQHFMTGEFLVGRAPAWPQGVPIWGYLSGLMLVASAISIVINQKTRLIVACTGLVILIWAGGRNLFITLSTLDYGGQLTNTGKSFTIGFGALLVASTFAPPTPWLKHASLLASIFTGLFFVASGIQHFIFIDFVKTLVPRWIPGDVFWSYVAGVGLTSIGIALITGILRKQAAFIGAWMVYIWFVVLHVPRGFGETANLNEWTAIFEALMVPSILTIIYWREKGNLS